MLFQIVWGSRGIESFSRCWISNHSTVVNVNESRILKSIEVRRRMATIRQHRLCIVLRLARTDVRWCVLYFVAFFRHHKGLGRKCSKNSYFAPPASTSKPPNAQKHFIYPPKSIYRSQQEVQNGSE